MRFLGYIAVFVLGTWVGVILMALCVAAGRHEEGE